MSSQIASKSQPINNAKIARREKRAPRTRTRLLRGNFLLYDESGDNLKLFSEPSNNGRKGVVFENTRKVMDAFPRVSNVSVSREGKLSVPLTNSEVEKCVFYDHHEGALIRVYYAEGSWRVSTQKKIDAFRSKWSGRQSFGELWVEALAAQKGADSKNVLMDFFKTLDTNSQYMFLLRHNRDNRVVCDSPETPRMYHVGTWIKGVLHSDHDIGLEKPASYRFPTVDTLTTHVSELDCRHVSGCMGIVNGKWHKLQNDRYLELEKIRGNESSLRFRYLQLRLDGAMVQDLYELFPEKAEEFDECEDKIYAMAKYIHKAYMDRFVRRLFVKLEREFFTIMHICHDWHKEDRQHNKVDLDKVIEVINTRYDHVLNKMIKMFTLVQKRERENDREFDAGRENDREFDAGRE
jgi:hypothetical protein